MTPFFVPGVEPGQAEVRFRQLADVAAAEVPGPAERVLSVRFVRDAEEWTARVGEPLAGRLAAPTARRSAPARRVTDPATVQAVLPAGEGYLVVTDAPPVGTVGDSTWDNPFTVARREAREVVRFDGPARP